MSLRGILACFWIAMFLAIPLTIVTGAKIHIANAFIVGLIVFLSTIAYMIYCDIKDDRNHV